MPKEKIYVEPMCGNCKFFKQDTCRRYPPSTQAMGLDAAGEMKWRTDWPDVGASDWCGEYKQGPTAAETK